jgi:5'-3' exonuclease
MGIPYYFLTLIKKHPRIVSKVRERFHTDVLAIDFNCLIHNYLDDANPIESILAALQMILSTVVKPDVLFIAMDGLVPYAKIVQQRYRRFRKPEHDSVIFDRHQISPGTPYMRELTEAIASRFPAAIISSTMEPGEGEHKIFQWLTDAPKHVTIYGLDADLILLSLKDVRISLLRENVNFKTSNTAGFSCLSIHELVKVLPIPTIQYISLSLLCFGNDFMPSIGMFSLREGGHERALQVYTECGSPDLLTVKGRRIFMEHAAKYEMTVYKSASSEKFYEKIIVSDGGKHFEARYNAHLQDGADPEDVVNDYWYCFYWTRHYFTLNQVLDWNFVYRFPEAPLVSQILRYPEGEPSIRVDEPRYTITKQLQFILPSASLRTAKKRVCYSDEIYDNPQRIPWMRKYEWEVDPRISLPFIEGTTIALSFPIV